MNADSTTVDRPPRTLVATNNLYLLVVVALATTLMLQSMRVFTSYMVFVIDQANRVDIALTVFSTFLSIALGGLVLWQAGFRRTLLLSAFLFGLARLGFQFWDSPEGRLVLGAIALATWGWLMIAVFRHWRESAAIGVGFGIALDVVIRIFFVTRDLPWNPGAVEHLLSVVLVVGMMVGIAGIRALRIEQLPELSTRGAWSLLAVGPGLALYHVVSGNLGMVQVSAGMNFPEGAFLIALGTAIGLRFSLMAGEFLGTESTSRVSTGPLVIGIILAISLFLIGQGGVLAIPGFILAPAATLVLMTFAVAGRASPDEARTPLVWLTVAFTAGLLAKVGMLFLYLVYSGNPIFLGIIAGVFVITAVPAGVPDVSRPIYQPRMTLIGAGVMAAALALVSGWHLLTWSTPEAGPIGGEEITVMTYNIQNGFDLENRWDLEAIAQTIENEDPDVVAIQEIPRGWLVTASVDQVTWLSQRLEMPFVYGSNADDGVWGNAVFSRLPIADSDTTQYSVTENLMRGAVEVSVETEAGLVWIYGTHLDNPSDADHARLVQAREFLEFWDGKRPALLLGDFNALPETELIADLAEAGFLDLGIELPAGAYTTLTRGRIDYIFGTDEFEVVDIHVTEVWTSDHLPVIATVRIAD
jgi:endonuclease/exonuclease/phosphatase family metal-dependent hydrolase